MGVHRPIDLRTVPTDTTPTGSVKAVVGPEIRPPAGKLPIGHGWVTAPVPAPVLFPSVGSVVARAPVGDAAQATAAVDAAWAVRRSLAALTAGARIAVLSQVAELITAKAALVVDLLVLETGKPRVDCVT